MSRKRFFANTISDKIIELINAEPLLADIKSVSKGDLTTLPPDETLRTSEFINMFFPAILVCPEDIYNTTVNGNKSISSSQYYFNIRYLRHFGDNAYTNVLELAINDAEIIGDLLLEDSDLSLVPNQLIKDASYGASSVTVQTPCTLNLNELIKIGSENLRIENKIVSPVETVLHLNTALHSPHPTGEVILRVTSPEIPKLVELVDTNNISIGQILRTEVPHIGIDTVEQELFFMSRDIPVVVISIEYIVVFRSYYVK